MGHHLGARTGRPGPELIDRGSPERVGGSEQHRSPLGVIPAGELADRGRLARPIHSDDQDDRGQSRPGRLGSPPAGFARYEQGGELRTHGRLRCRGVVPATRPLDDIHGQAGPDVAGDERLLDVVPGWPARTSAQEATQPTDEPGSTLLEPRREVARRFVERLDVRSGLRIRFQPDLRLDLEVRGVRFPPGRDPLRIDRRCLDLGVLVPGFPAPEHAD